MTEKEKMLKGEIYDSGDSELVSLRAKCHRLCQAYNALADTDRENRNNILKEMGIKMGKGSYLQGPIYIDYGCFTSIGERTYVNFNLTILDTCEVKIGNDVFIGSGVSLLTPLHPMEYKERNYYINEESKWKNKEYGAPIIIKDNCWICSNVSILPGVTIGEGSVIGAGSVVTHDIPDNCFAAGNPCKVIKQINNQSEK